MTATTTDAAYATLAQALWITCPSCHGDASDGCATCDDATRIRPLMEVCPDCVEYEDDVPYGNKYITKGSVKTDNLEIYGCARCGGSGGGKERREDMEFVHVDKVSGKSYNAIHSWNDRMKAVDATYGTGSVPVPFVMERVQATMRQAGYRPELSWDGTWSIWKGSFHYGLCPSDPTDAEENKSAFLDACNEALGGSDGA